MPPKTNKKTLRNLAAPHKSAGNHQAPLLRETIFAPKSTSVRRPSWAEPKIVRRLPKVVSTCTPRVPGLFWHGGGAGVPGRRTFRRTARHKTNGTRSEFDVGLEQADRWTCPAHVAAACSAAAKAPRFRRPRLPACRVGRARAARQPDQGGARGPPGTGAIAKVHAVRSARRRGSAVRFGRTASLRAVGVIKDATFY